MAKPVEIITTIEGEDARILLEELKNPPKNKAWEKTLERARKINID